MSAITEIYICQPGQALKEGKLVVSYDVTNRDHARTDAVARCRLDKNIARIIYYAIRDDGDFRTLYSHDNPNAPAPRAQRSLVADVTFAPAPKFRRAPARNWFARLRGFFETH